MTDTKLVSLVVPVFNEEAAIQPFLRAIEKVSSSIDVTFGGRIRIEIVFVNDGSRDRTLSRILAAQRATRTIRAIDLSRRFGKEAALTAGFAEARGDAVIPLDVDLQDPPALIVPMISKWLEGSKVVLARRADRSDDSVMKRRSARWFYRLHNLISDIRIPADVGDYRLMDRLVVDAINQLPENRRFMKGLFAWVGFEPSYIDYKRQPRQTGQSKFSTWRLWRFALEGITSFSAVPLVVWTYIGLAVAGAALAYALFIVVRTILFGIDVPGYASLLVAILFLGGIQILGIGVLGEYIGRIYWEAKRRPSYVIAQRFEPDFADEGSSDRKAKRSQEPVGATARAGGQPFSDSG